MHLPPNFEEFTKPARCGYHDCIAPAKLRLEIKVWAKGYSKATTKPIEMATSVKVCPNHTYDVSTNGGFWTDEGKKMVRSALRGVNKAEPDFDTCEFEWVPL